MKNIDIRANRERNKQLATAKGPKKFPRVTVLSYGKTRSGKTQLAASFPRPLIIADSSESGWTTVESMSEDQFFDPTFIPEVMAIENLEDLLNLQKLLPPIIQAKKIETIVVDGLTFINDLMLDDMDAKGMGRNEHGKDDARSLYNKLKNFLRHFRITIHNLGTNVVWNCLESSVDEKTKKSGPQLNGQSREIFPAGCDLFLYQTALRRGAGVEYQTHTTQYGPYPAGGRFGAKLPQMVIDLTYRKLCHYIFENGLEKDEVVESSEEEEATNENDTEEPDNTEALPKVKPVAAPVPRPVPAPVRQPVTAAKRS